MRRCSLILPLLLPLAAACQSTVRYTPLVSLGNNIECVKCEGFVLPGERVPREDWVYAIHSDLPEIFHTEGVLYSTRPVLPPFDTYKDGPLGVEMRTQVNRGFDAIDAPFEVFLYHLSEPGGGTAPRRLVVFAENLDREGAPVEVDAKWVFEGTGQMGSADGPETRLAVAVTTDAMPGRATRSIAPGSGAIVAWSPIFSASADGEDQMRSAFINGIVRARVARADGQRPRLQVTVLAISGTAPQGEWDARVLELLETGAKSGETAMDLRIAPPQCHLRRVVGVYRNFLWRGGGRFDVTALPGGEARFQMALPAAQAMECPAGVQTGPMLLHPPYVHPETIGNYTIQHEVDLVLHNPGDTPRVVDVRFGKQDASVGLEWRVATAAPGAGLEFGPLGTGWAGAWTKDDDPDNARSFLLDGPLTLAPGEERVVALRFGIIGTSSLPFQIHLVARPAAD